MKKFIKLTFVFVLATLLTGCKGKEVITKCTLTSDQSASGYSIESNYNIYSTNNEVSSVRTEEIVTSNNNTVLSYFEDQLKNQYKSYSDTYGGYTYEVTNKDGKVTSIVTIDYNKMDLAKFITDNVAMKSYVNKNNKLTLSGIKTMYQSIGATCD